MTETAQMTPLNRGQMAQRLAQGLQRRAVLGSEVDCECGFPATRQVIRGASGGLVGPGGTPTIS